MYVNKLTAVQCTLKIAALCSVMYTLCYIMYLLNINTFCCYNYLPFCMGGEGIRKGSVLTATVR
jgi:hypothetical protein